MASLLKKKQIKLEMQDGCPARRQVTSVVAYLIDLVLALHTGWMKESFCLQPKSICPVIYGKSKPNRNTLSA